MFPKYSPNYSIGSDFPDLEPSGGLTRLELFAAFAMHAHIVVNLPDNHLSCEDLAKGSIAAANAMIEALDKNV